VLTADSYYEGFATGFSSDWTCVLLCVDSGTAYGYPDTDLDGLANTLDLSPGSPSLSFNDGATTSGAITAAGGLKVSVMDMPNPAGIRVTASGTGGPATVSVCSSPVTVLTVSVGDIFDVTCSSASISVDLGPVEVSFGTMDASIPPGTGGTITETAPGVYNVEHDNGGGTIVAGGVSVGPGQSMSVTDLDADGLANQADPDDDGDGSSDMSDVGACGGDNLNGSVQPERVDGIFAGIDDDGNEGADEGLPGGAGGLDCDGDGFTGNTEAHVYSYVPQTNGDQKTCQEYDLSHPNPNADIKPSLRWPADFNKATGVLNSFNKIDVLDLTSFLAPVKYLGTNVGTNPDDVRWDLRPGPEVFGVDINAADLTALLAGTTGNPPMLFGAKAFGAPACPFAP
jgi:hypothetical protein